MEQKGAFTVAMLTGVVLLSCLACTVSCRPKGNLENSSSSSNSSPSTTNNNSYLKGQQYQAQRYDTHHHHHSRGTNTEKSHHHHHNSNHPHHHSKRGHIHHEKQGQQQQYHYREQEDAFQRDTEIDESNRISLLHTGPQSAQGKRMKQRQQQQQQQPPLALPVVEAPSTKTARATTATTTSSSDNFPVPRRLHSHMADEDYEEYDEEEEDDTSSGGGRHAYLMTTDKKKSSKEKMTEDQALTQAFEKHMRPSNVKPNPKEEVHDVYAYQLPSDLWFVVRYNKNADGQVEKYMNIVDSFTNYLDKLDKDVKTVSVNVKGVETVFRLTTKHNNSSNS